MAVRSASSRFLDEPPLRVLVIDKLSVFRNTRDRYRRLLERANVDLTLLVPERWIENALPVAYEPEPDEPFATVIGRPSLPGRELRSIYLSGMARAFGRSRPEVILMMEEAFSLFAVQTLAIRRFLAPTAPLIFYSNNIVSYEHYNYRLEPLYRAIGKYVLKRAEAGLCVNDRATAVLREAGYAGISRTLFQGINERVYKPIPRNEARHRIGVPEDLDLFVYAGRLLAMKGVHLLIDAFARLRAARPDRPLRLLIVGDGDYAPQLRAQVESLGLAGSVEFHPTVPIADVPCYMCAATALVLPSLAEWQEQFGRVNAEAMLTESLMIGSTSGAIPSVIGDGGFIFRADDVDDLLRTMTLVLDDPAEAERRRRAGRGRALREYSFEAFADGLVDLFEELTGRTIRRDD
jgi:glycosyltransferase involved in cell wall biosynthesis